MHEAIIALISAGIPAIVTLITNLHQNAARDRMQDEIQSQAERLSAKQAILQMILEDEFHYELNGKFPMNYERIQDEYATYHAHGGNGEVTKKFQEYNEWYKKREDNLKKGDEKWRKI